jgi:hypothetical protein
MTRSLIATGHLHFVDAVAFHPLGPPVLLLLMFYCAAHFMKMGFHKGQVKAIPRSVPIVMTACFVIVWVARLLGFLPTPS